MCVREKERQSERKRETKIKEREEDENVGGILENRFRPRVNLDHDMAHLYIFLKYGTSS
jgi:hypothetical protein